MDGQMALPDVAPVGLLSLEIYVSAEGTCSMVAVREKDPHGALIAEWTWPLPKVPENALDQAVRELTLRWMEHVSPF